MNICNVDKMTTEDYRKLEVGDVLFKKPNGDKPVYRIVRKMIYLDKIILSTKYYFETEKESTIYIDNNKLRDWDLFTNYHFVNELFLEGD